MTNPAHKPSVVDHFDPIALGLAMRSSPSGFASTFGQDAARAVSPLSLSTAVDQIASRSNLAPRAAMTSDEFATILTDFVNVMALQGYSYNRPAILAVSHETSVKDFRPHETVRGQKAPTLLPVPEGAEVQYGSVGDGVKEAWAAMRYSRLLEFTEVALVNDNLGLLSAPALAFGEVYADFKASIIIDRILANPLMSDGEAVFSAAHGNLAGTGAALSVASVSAARLAMRRQKDIDGVRPINVEPTYLVVPPELETDAEQLMTTITPNSVDSVNPLANRLTIIVEPRLTDPAAWYLFARPERRLGLEHGGIDGMDDLEVRSEARLERHAVVTRISTTFGAGWIDHRGAYRNPGA